MRVLGGWARRPTQGAATRLGFMWGAAVLLLLLLCRRWMLVDLRRLLQNPSTPLLLHPLRRLLLGRPLL